jgi:glycosyltransferase involved in cell wall biosynthesis
LCGSFPESEWIEAMTGADVALVTMKPGAEDIVMPSKTYSAMAAGQAILAVCPRESDLADTVTKHDCGWVIEPGDVAGLRALLESLPQRAAEVLAKRHNSWNAARECYDQKVLAVRWREVLGEVSRVAKP